MIEFIVGLTVGIIGTLITVYLINAWGKGG